MAEDIFRDRTKSPTTWRGGSRGLHERTHKGLSRRGCVLVFRRTYQDIRGFSPRPEKRRTLAGA
ncbi:MAG: hypothetical protein M3323_15915 [Actinomycetota bacterium]|nr:hypothetical protein [Actinomycetota bacterium]